MLAIWEQGGEGAGCRDLRLLLRPVQLRDDTVIHHVELSLFPNWSGVDQERLVEVTGNRLTLRTRPFLLGGMEQRARSCSGSGYEHDYDGRVDATFTPADLLALLLGLTGAWFTASEAIRTHDTQEPWSPKRLSSGTPRSRQRRASSGGK